MEITRERELCKGPEIREWERRILKTLGLRHIRACTMSLETIPSKPCFFLAVDKLFPVLESATLRTFSYDRFDLEACFDTSHGKVLLLGSFDASKCKVNIGKDHDVNVIVFRTDEHDHGRYTVILSLVVHRVCAQCGAVEGKLMRCDRCWRKMGFPVYYCGEECQAAHYPQHRINGCGAISSALASPRRAACE
jgi:hypothetical protein